MAGVPGRLGAGRPQPMRALGSLSPPRVLRLSEAALAMSEAALATLGSPPHISIRGGAESQLSSPPLSRISGAVSLSALRTSGPAWSPPVFSDDEEPMFSASARPAARDETAREEQSVAFRMNWDELRSWKLIAVCLAEKQVKPDMFKNHTTMEKVSMTRVNKAFWPEEMGLKAIP
jgi:hypothetical protein